MTMTPLQLIESISVSFPWWVQIIVLTGIALILIDILKFLHKKAQTLWHIILDHISNKQPI